MRNDQSEEGQPTRTTSKQVTMDKNGSNVVLTVEVVTSLPLDENDNKQKVDRL